MFQGMEYVLAVYEEQSFSKAAKKLFISQPSLSANIKRIEKRIGFSIFDRSTIPLTLTELGSAYVQSAQKMMQIEEDFVHYISDYSNLKRGKLIIGGSSLFVSLVLPHVMAAFAKQYPDLELDLVEETTQKLERMLRDGEIDLLLDNTLLDEAIFSRMDYVSEEIILAVPKIFEINQELTEYQLTSADFVDGNEYWNEVPAVPFEKFKSQEFVLLNEENDTGHRAIELCHEYGFEPKVIFNVEQQLTAYNISASGMAISFVGDTLVRHIPESNQIIYYRLKGKDMNRKIFLYWKKSRYLSKAMTAFIKLIEDNMRK